MLSVAIPVYNEERNLPILTQRIHNVLQNIMKVKHEIIFINDGSTDNSLSVLLDLKKKYSNIKIISFAYNQGQTMAMERGFQAAKGNIIITMDADLQNFPEDIPRLINKINNGFDVVCGWRYKRKDNFISKNLPSYLSNFLIRIITGLKIKDSGCSLRAYKKEAIKNLHLFGDLHRFIPIILAKKGLKITQIKVKHTKRIYGESKYGLLRFFIGFPDLLFVLFLSKYSRKQLYILRLLVLIAIITGIPLLILMLVQTIIKYLY